MENVLGEWDLPFVRLLSSSGTRQVSGVGGHRNHTCQYIGALHSPFTFPMTFSKNGGDESLPTKASAGYKKSSRQRLVDHPSPPNTNVLCVIIYGHAFWRLSIFKSDWENLGILWLYEIKPPFHADLQQRMLPKGFGQYKPFIWEEYFTGMWTTNFSSRMVHLVDDSAVGLANYGLEQYSSNSRQSNAQCMSDKCIRDATASKKRFMGRGLSPGTTTSRGVLCLSEPERFRQALMHDVQHGYFSDTLGALLVLTN
ncbi:hypothetical protein BDZ97DRAFT_2016845 [Flammula alnicola]|nr:hypothetical protein BDZ97DRAFT_2016845 [Flammula alnicola]